MSKARPFESLTLRTGQALAVAALAAMLLVAGAGPAAADPAEPTHYRSVVNAVDPRPTGVTVEVIGGDSFLSIAAAPGHTVEVPGYFGEPYLEIDADQRVWLNTRSPARYINRDRYGLSGVPDSADQAADPEWEQVGSDGRLAWHDHRIHWMSTDLPPSITGDRAEIVFPWTLRIVIDGTETEVRGELLWFPATNPVGPILTGIVGLLPLLAWRRGRLTPVAVASAATGALVLAVAVAQFGATPAFDRGVPVGAAIPAVSIVAAVVALWLRSGSIRAWAATALSAIGLLWWALSTSAALTAPVLPSAVPVALERSAVALAAWIGLAAAAIAVFEFTRLARPQSRSGAGQPAPERSVVA